MADEIKIAHRVNVSKNGASVARSTSDSITMTGTAMGSITATATTSWGALTLPNAVSSEHSVLIENLDATNYIQVAVDSGGSNIFGKALAGEVIHVHRAPAGIYVRANTASVSLLVTAWVS